jgi:hypothetical protein
MLKLKTYQIYIGSLDPSSADISDQSRDRSPLSSSPKSVLSTSPVLGKKPMLDQGQTVSETKPTPIIGQGQTVTEIKPTPIIGQGQAVLETKPTPIIGEAVLETKPEPILGLGQKLTETKPTQILGQGQTVLTTKPIEHAKIEHSKEIQEETTKPQPNVQQFARQQTATLIQQPTTSIQHSVNDYSLSEKPVQKHTQVTISQGVTRQVTHSSPLQIQGMQVQAKEQNETAKQTSTLSHPIVQMGNDVKTVQTMPIKQEIKQQVPQVQQVPSQVQVPTKVQDTPSKVQVAQVTTKVEEKQEKKVLVETTAKINGGSDDVIAETKSKMQQPIDIPILR